MFASVVAMAAASASAAAEGRGARRRRTCVFSAMKGYCANCRSSGTGWLSMVFCTSYLTSRKASENEISPDAVSSTLTSEAV